MKPRTVDAARGRWVSILLALGVDETFLRNKHGPCPFCGGKDRYRFDDKDGNGTWFCTSCGPGRGIEFVMKLKFCDFKTACSLIDPLVGSAKLETARRKKDSRPWLRKVWTESSRLSDGDVVSKYLGNRHLSAVCDDMRCHPGIAYWSEGQKSGAYPAMLALLRSSTGEPTTMHVTYLSGASKAPVTPAKKLMTPVAKTAGSAVRLCDPADGRIAIAEGIETALAYTKLYGVPCWAATNATLLAQFEPPEGITSVTVAADNDAKFTGQYAAYALANRLAMRGLDVRVDVPNVVDTDWCDLLSWMISAGGDV